MYVVYINLLYFLSIFLFTYNKNLLSQKKGPMTEPCGTPIDIGMTWETISPICTNCLRLLR